MSPDIFGLLQSHARRAEVLYCDAMEYLIGGAHLHYERMLDTAKTASERAAAGQIGCTTEEMTAIVTDVAALIGTINRLRVVVVRLPGDKSTRIAKNAFMAAARLVEPVRNHLEHLDTSIAKVASSGQGPFGGISWWYQKGRSALLIAIVPGHLAKHKDAVVSRAPSHMRGEVDHFWVTIGGQVFDLSDTYWAVVSLEERLRAWSQQQQKDSWPALRRPGRP